MRRRLAALAVAGVVLAGCAAGAVPSRHAPPSDDAPWKVPGGGVVITAAPDAGGILSFRNCPTLDEARAAMPAITGGPDANGVPFKTMVLQCSYDLPGRDVQGRPAGISILVFDAVPEGRSTFEWTLDSDTGSPTPIAGLGDSASWTDGRGSVELWVVSGRFGLHLLHTSPEPLDAEALAALAQAAVGALARPPR